MLKKNQIASYTQIFFYTKIFFLNLVFFTHTADPLFANKNKLNLKSQISYFTNDTFGLKKNYAYTNGLSLKTNANFKTDNISSNLTFNINKKYNTFNDSYLEYSRGIGKLGIGKVDRHWSFSENTSLILSSNASPPISVYFELKNNFNNQFLPQTANWSFEAFNASTKKSLNGNKSKLFGNRLVFSPTERLKFELIRTSQWGGDGYDNDLKGFFKLLFIDSNEIAANVNHLAGMGFSYETNAINPTQIYGQIIGEDEAGLLPMCFMHLIGIKYNSYNLRYANTIGLEYNDTRIKQSSGGFCGANTAYNNHIYSYTNDGVVMGSYLDTESKSIKVFGDLHITSNLNFKHSIERITINDKNWSSHRLSSSKAVGNLVTMALSWKKDNITLVSQLNYQNISLNKPKTSDGLNIGISTTIEF